MWCINWAFCVKPQSNILTEPYVYCRIICSKGMRRSKDGSYKKNVGSSSRKYPFRTEQNLSICLTPTEIWFLITFQVKCVVNAGPNREEFRHMLKTSELGQGLQKDLWSLGWPDQESKLAPSLYQTCQGDPQGEEKVWRKQQDHLETLQKAKNAS